MTILGTAFVLAVPDLARSGAFYRDVLGFEIREMGDPGWRLQSVTEDRHGFAGAVPSVGGMGAISGPHVH